MKKDDIIPRKEYPRPQFQRKSWLNLNGQWDFSIDSGNSGLDRELPSHPELFTSSIIVPFCPESLLSGVCNKDFMESVFYHRKVTFPKSWDKKRILLHFGAVDWHSRIWIDGEVVGEHRGGSAPFSLDITKYAKPGMAQSLVVHALDHNKSWEQGLGKQSRNYYSSACTYTRTTGIWQTVWAEAVNFDALKSCDITPNPDAKQVVLTPHFYTTPKDSTLHIVITENKKTVADKKYTASSGIPLAIDIPNPIEWSPSKPFLYDIKLKVENNGKLIDEVNSYFAMRKVSIEGNRILLNNKPIFLRFVLDQGFYKEGIWTAPSDKELKADIERSMAAGFNGARLHQKVFEDRFHYWADKLGYLTWAEYPSGGFSCLDPTGQRNFLEEWGNIVTYLKNHPSIIGWSPLNETTENNIGDAAAPWEKEGNPMIREYRLFIHNVANLTRSLDPSRPVNDSSGWIHADTDLWTVHNYLDDAKELHDWLCPKDAPIAARFPRFETSYYSGQPYLIDEWGGVRYIRKEDREGDNQGWGYGKRKIETPDDYLTCLSEMTEMFAKIPNLSGWCFTQLTDIEQEQNGVYTYTRKAKVPLTQLAKVFSVKPEWSIW